MIDLKRVTRSALKKHPCAVYASPDAADFHLENALKSAIASEADESTPNSVITLQPLSNCVIAPVKAAAAPKSLPHNLSDRESTDPEACNDGLTCGQKRRRLKKKEHSHSHRKKRRTADLNDSATPKPTSLSGVRDNISACYNNGGLRVMCSTAAKDARVASTGFIGLNDRGDPQANREYTLSQVTGVGSELGFELKEWDGKTPTMIVDKSGRVIAVLAGRPNDKDWDAVHQEAADVLENSRARCKLGVDHRRREFSALNCGVSFGGGQRHPMNLKNTAAHKRVVEDLCSKSCFERIAGFGSAILKNRAPLIYDHYFQNLQDLCRWEEQEKSAIPVDKVYVPLKRPFKSSIFSASTFNLGPQTVCCKHKDFGNLAYGWCVVTSLGYFDHKKGGHLILWDCALVVEFPPGSTILLPSAVISHSNVKLGCNERRYSFAQYTLGGLFRWARNNFQTAAVYFAGMTTQEREKREKEDSERWELGLSLWPTVSLCNAQE